MLHTFQKEEYQREYNILMSLIPDDVRKILKQLHVRVAGGTLTSLFSNREVNDIDLYFPSWEAMEVFIAYMNDSKLRAGEYDLTKETNGWSHTKRSLFYFNGLDTGIPFHLGEKPPERVLTLTELFEISRLVAMNPHEDSEDDEEAIKVSHISNIGMTDKSVMFSTGGLRPVLQCICFDTFPTAQEIFDKFDFTINMGAFNFGDDTWEFDKNFMKHIAQKVLVINTGTDYPIISMLRSDKYRARGYTISRRETMKISLSCSRLNIQSWEDAKDHLSGMYGTNVEDLFNESKPFSFELLFDKLDRAGDKLISSVATEKEKGSSSTYNLSPVEYFETLQRLRRNTGRPYFKTLWGVVSTTTLYLMQAHLRTHKLGMLEDVVAKRFVAHVDLYVDEAEARAVFERRGADGGRDGPGNRIPPGAALVEVSISNTDSINYTNYQVEICDEEKTTLRVEKIIDSNGELS